MWHVGRSELLLLFFLLLLLLSLLLATFATNTPASQPPAIQLQFQIQLNHDFGWLPQLQHYVGPACHLMSINLQEFFSFCHIQPMSVAHQPHSTFLNRGLLFFCSFLGGGFESSLETFFHGFIFLWSLSLIIVIYV